MRLKPGLKPKTKKGKLDRRRCDNKNTWEIRIN